MDKLIIKYLSNKATDSEKRELFQWIESNTENEKYFIEYKKLFALYPESLDLNKDKAWSYISKKAFRPSAIRRHIYAVLKYAAVVVIAFFIFKYAGILKPEGSDESYHTFAIAEGQIEKITLSDGTRIWLNSGSELKIPSDFSPGNREVSIEGQGYFEVFQDPGSPFSVVTEHATISVLGTRFNLNTYHPDYLETTLIEGKIQLYSENELVTELVPGEKLVFNYSNRSIEREYLGNTDFYSSWTTGNLKFDRIPLFSILEILEKWYRVDFIFDDEVIGMLKFSGTLLKDEDLDQSINLIESSSNLKFDRIKSFDNEIIRIYK